MRLIRQGTFETNSSSTHAIVIPHKVKNEEYSLHDSLFHEYSFGRGGYKLVDDWDEKLAYLYITIVELNNYKWDKNQFEITDDMINDFKQRVNKIYDEVYNIVEYKPYRDDINPNYIFKLVDKNDDYNFYVDHVGEFAEEYDFFEKVFNDDEFLKRFIFNRDSYITIGGDEYSGYCIKTIGFEYDYNEEDYPQYQVNEKGEKCPNIDEFPDTDEGWEEYWETQKKYPIVRDNGGFWDKLLEYEKDNDVYLKGN